MAMAGDAALHVDAAAAVQHVALDDGRMRVVPPLLPLHGNGVEVAVEQQGGFPSAAAPSRHHVGAALGEAVQLHLEPGRLQPLAKQLGHRPFPPRRIAAVDADEPAQQVAQLGGCVAGVLDTGTPPQRVTAPPRPTSVSPARLSRSTGRRRPSSPPRYPDLLAAMAEGPAVEAAVERLGRRTRSARGGAPSRSGRSSAGRAAHGSWPRHDRRPPAPRRSAPPRSSAGPRRSGASPIRPPGGPSPGWVNSLSFSRVLPSCPRLEAIMSSRGSKMLNTRRPSSARWSRIRPRAWR